MKANCFQKMSHCSTYAQHICSISHAQSATVYTGLYNQSIFPELTRDSITQKLIKVSGTLQDDLSVAQSFHSISVPKFLDFLGFT